MADLKLTAKIVGEDKLSGPVNQAAKSLQGLEQATQQSNSAFQTMQGILASQVVTRAFDAATSAIGGTIQAAADFESQMNAIKAVTGASAEDMDALSKEALQLGKDTTFSASEAAAGIGELAKGGVSVADIMGGAAAAALDLAAAGGVNVGEAASIAANAMSLFNLKGEDMGKVVDNIAGFANATTGSVNDFKFALSSVGAAAALSGQDFDQTATAIGLMGRAGILGSDAGTSLKTMLLNLVPTTKSATAAMKDLGIITADGSNQFLDAEGNFKDLRDIAGILSDALAGASESQKSLALETIFGSDAIRAATILTNAGAEGFDAMAEAMGNVEAHDVAETRLKGLNGALEAFHGSVETAAIIIGTAFLPALTAMVEAGTNLLNDWVIPWTEQYGPQIKDTLALVADAFGQAVGFIKTNVLPIFGLLADQSEESRSRLEDSLGTLGSWLTGEVLPNAVSALLSLGTAFWQWVTDALPPLRENLLGLASGILTFIADQVAPFTQTLAAEWAPAFIGWVLGTALPELLKALGTAVLQVTDWLVSGGAMQIATAANALGLAVITGTLAGLAKLGSMLADWFTTNVPPVLSAIGAVVRAEAERIGTEIIQGVQHGIEAGIGSVKAAAAQMAQSALDSAKATLGIPGGSSLVFKQEVGAEIPEGTAHGILGGIDLVIAAAQQMANAAVDAASNVVDRELPRINDGFTSLGRVVHQIMGSGGDVQGDLASFTGQVENAATSVERTLPRINAGFASVARVVDALIGPGGSAQDDIDSFVGHANNGFTSVARLVQQLIGDGSPSQVAVQSFVTHANNGFSSVAALVDELLGSGSDAEIAVEDFGALLAETAEESAAASARMQASIDAWAAMVDASYQQAADTVGPNGPYQKALQGAVTNTQNSVTAMNNAIKNLTQPGGQPVFSNPNFPGNPQPGTGGFTPTPPGQVVPPTTGGGGGGVTSITSITPGLPPGTYKLPNGQIVVIGHAQSGALVWEKSFWEVGEANAPEVISPVSMMADTFRSVLAETLVPLMQGTYDMLKRATSGPSLAVGGANVYNGDINIYVTAPSGDARVIADQVKRALTIDGNRNGLRSR